MQHQYFVTTNISLGTMEILLLILLLKQMKHKFFVNIVTNLTILQKNYFKIKGYLRRNGCKPQANTTTCQPAPHHPDWIIDTRASYHIAQDLEHLTMVDSYPGSDQV